MRFSLLTIIVAVNLFGIMVWMNSRRHRVTRIVGGTTYSYSVRGWPWIVRADVPTSWQFEDGDEVCPTISARYHKDGAEALIERPGENVPRRLTPNEMRDIFRFPDDFKIPVSDTQAYRQFGNSIVVSVAEAVVGAVVTALARDTRRVRRSRRPVLFSPQGDNATV